MNGLLRPNIPPPPGRIAKLPVDHRGYPVPYFVAWIDGKPDFRVVDPERMAMCVRFGRCWLCGEQLGANIAFVIGPMCAINRTSSEPGSHRECAVYAARACPFLTMPKMDRREAGLPEVVVPMGGQSIRRNPGVALVWVTRSVKLFRDERRKLLFEVGEPIETLWFAEGRPARREEVLRSIESGLPELEAMAESDADRALLKQMTATAIRLLPTEVTP